MSLENASGSQSPKKEKKKIVLVNVEDLAEQSVHDAAERQMTESKEKMKGFSGFFKKIWKHGLAHEYYRQKEVARASEAIRKDQDIYAAEKTIDTEHTAHAEAMGAIVERFSHEYEEMLHTGETRQSFTQAEEHGNPLGDELRAELTHLIREYASGTLDDESFKEARTRVLDQVTTRKGGTPGAMYADNLLEVAKQVRMSVEHDRGLEALDTDFEIVLGKARGSVNTEADYNTVDKAIEVLRKSPIGTLVNESTLTAGVAIASAVTVGFGKRLLSSRVAAWATFGGTAALAGLFAGIAENKRFKEDRRQHAREKAQGRTWAEDSPRREEMDTLVYEMKSAQELTEKIRTILYVQDEKEGERLNEKLSVEQLESVLAQLSDIEARIQLNDREKIDLISYSDPRKIEQERLALDLLRARAKRDIRNVQAAADLPADLSTEEFLALATEERMKQLTAGTGGIEERDALFDKMKKQRVAKAAAIGVLGGLVAGTVAQEGMAFLDDRQTGLIERAVTSNTVASPRTTALEHLYEYISGNTLPAGPLQSVTIGNGKIQLPASMTLVPSQVNGGGYVLLQGQTTLAEGIQFTKDGALDPRSAKILSEQGIQTTSAVEYLQKKTQGIVGTKQYLAEHPDLATRVQRKLWYDNDTPKPVFDKNELKLWWGGDKNTGIDAKGNYSFSIKQMMPGGSYHGNLSANALKLAQEGQLKMLFSISADTQAHPIAVPINPDGTVSIDPNSETGKLLFKTVNGKAQFLGRFAEVAEVISSKNNADQVRILATHEGKGVGEIMTDVPSKTAVPRTIFGAPPTTPDLPPVLPFFGRTPLETPNGIPGANPFIKYYGKSPATSAERKEYRKKMSEALIKDSDAKLDPQKEAEKYLGKQTPAYREHIENLVAQTEPMSAECKLAVCIPVAGHQEENNIERTLSAYVKQKGVSPNAYEIVLFVNHPDKDELGKEIQPDKTLEKINAFKTAHPEIPIRVMRQVLPRSEARIGNIRKLLNDATLARSVKRNGRSDLILVSNDADVRGIAPEYIANFIEKFEKNENTDALAGQLDWDPESYIRNPLIHIGTRLMQYMSMQYRKSGRGTESSGANFAFRSSIYAAIGGYTPDIGLAEDVDLGRRITYARYGAKNYKGIDFAGARTSRIYTSSRRAEKAVREGLSPSEQWEKGFSAFDDEVRKTKWEDTGTAPDYNNPEVVNKLTEELETIINRTLRVTSNWWGGTSYEQIQRRALGWLGITYRMLTPTRIKITNADKLIDNLREYQREGMELMARKTGAEPSKQKPNLSQKESAKNKVKKTFKRVSKDVGEGTKKAQRKLGKVSEKAREGTRTALRNTRKVLEDRKKRRNTRQGKK